MFFLARALMYAQIRLSGVRITPTQFPEALPMVEAAEAAGLRRVPDAYVMLGNGQINAFAAGHGHRRFIAVYFDLFEIGGAARDPEAPRSSSGTRSGTSPPATSPTSDSWSVPVQPDPGAGQHPPPRPGVHRDNFGYRFCPQGARGQIKVLAAGKYLNADVNFDELADRAVYERGLFTWLANLGMTHPANTWRAHALRDRSRPGRLIWRPKQNPPREPLSMVPAAEPAASWADPPSRPGASRTPTTPPRENQHWASTPPTGGSRWSGATPPSRICWTPPGAPRRAPRLRAPAGPHPGFLRRGSRSGRPRKRPRR